MTFRAYRPKSLYKMETIKKKLATFKEERDTAREMVEEKESEKKTQEKRADEVSSHAGFVYVSRARNCYQLVYVVKRDS